MSCVPVAAGGVVAYHCPPVTQCQTQQHPGRGTPPTGMSALCSAVVLQPAKSRRAAWKARCGAVACAPVSHAVYAKGEMGMSNPGFRPPAIPSKPAKF